ncbi:MAG: hypothetical protein H6723_01520 [Sandaracinus sp.]|nr:hypothetical protein [Sandaracinus sp.]
MRAEFETGVVRAARTAPVKDDAALQVYVASGGRAWRLVARHARVC